MTRVLVIPGGLQIGGAEKVAANIGLLADRSRFSVDYAVFEGYANDYGTAIEANGGRVFTLPCPSNSYIKFYKALTKLIANNGYEVVHAHTMFNSGICMLAAKACGARIRIAHSHTIQDKHDRTVVRRIYSAFMRKLILTYSTHLLACGSDAGKWLFGEEAFSKRGEVIPNGINTVQYAYSGQTRASMRNELGLTNNFVIGHVGTINPVKNQEYLIQLMKKISGIRSDARLLLVGGGDTEYEAHVRQLVQCLGLADKVIITGNTDRVSEYLNAMDVFAMPSVREGTPLALIEAQTNGLPCVISTGIPMDAVLTDLVKIEAINDRDRWITALLDSARNSPASYCPLVKSAGFDIEAAMNKLYSIYERGAV